MNERTMSCDEARDLAPAYVLGALDRADEAAVRGHLETCDQPHAEFEALGGVVPALLELDESELVEPPAALRDRIMAAAAADLAARAARTSPSAEQTTPTAERTIPFPTATERTFRAERRVTGRARPLDWALRIAAVLAIVAVGAWGVGLQAQLSQAQAFEQAVARVLETASEPGAKVAVLAPAEGQQGRGIAAVGADGSVDLAMRDLPATTGNEVYTTWVIIPDRAPTSVGDFRVGSTGVQTFTSAPATTPAGAQIVVTREPNAGNTAPAGPAVSAGVAVPPPGATG